MLTPMTHSTLPDRRTLLTGAAAALLLPAIARAAGPAVQRIAPSLDRIIAPGAAIETIATGIRWAEGPAWVAKGGYLLFSDPPANIVRRWQPRGGTAIFLSPSGTGGLDPKLVREPGANGLLVDRMGALLIANSGGRSLDRLDLATRKRTVLADRYQGKRFNSPNDMVEARDGTIWFTDPPYGLAEGDASPIKELPHNGVYRLKPGGQPELMVADLSSPNGIGLSPDERRLYVSISDPKAPRIMAYDLGADGRIGGGRVFLDAAPMMGPDAPGLPDGMKVARDGTLFCSAPGGLAILTPQGAMLGLIRSGSGPIANCAIGENGRTLFMAANDRILKVALARPM
ncbi:gluconolactonase [Sphingomonas metalli]|uniref:Gluconolactonase n=1 Tax=Sphingomonas metalli TaxID=1779358 RepID=A0A916WRT1_9SPHN|nr:SMP-30/gluconolactonase/LRE family protein [Sphingomonas metalli]GGB26643.1 gluconolactonase [Sphingomonas metalli]